MAIDESVNQRIDDFWSWFSAHAPKIADIKRGDHSSFDTIEHLLSRIHNGLMFEISGKEGEAVLVISADGVRDRIAYALTTVQRAPKIPGWKVLAFRQRTEVEFSLKFNNTEINSTDIWFELLANHDRVDVRVYVPHAVDTKSDGAWGIVFITLDQLLGEYDVMSKMGFLDIQSIPAFPRECGLITSNQLATEFDKLWAILSDNPGPN